MSLKKILLILTLVLILEALTIWLVFSSSEIHALKIQTKSPLGKPTNFPEKIELSFEGKNWQLEEPVGDEAVGQLLLGIASELGRPSQNAELVMENDRATKFTPHKMGVALDLAKTRKRLLENHQELVMVETPPLIKLGQLNNFGIEEILVTGQSDFSGSSRSRITNIKVGSSKFNGLIIKPGDEFSFNKNLGPITAKEGYHPEIVIKPEGLTPELGGGLCQVSTTAFRAAFFGGLPITQRKNHSLNVRYYAWIADDAPKAAGLDATIYPGAVDLKFRNDTPASILIWTRVEDSRLYFDFYGTPDEREVIVSGPEEFNKQSSGALKARVTRTVVKDGQKEEQVLNSTYFSPNRYPRLYTYPKPVEQPPTNNQ